jgi:hypothetical protein
MPIKVKKIGNRYHVVFETTKKLGEFDSEDVALKYVKEVRRLAKSKHQKEK